MIEPVIAETPKLLNINEYTVEPRSFPKCFIVSVGSIDVIAPSHIMDMHILKANSQVKFRLHSTVAIMRI